jgi:2-haloacid dehalogenase
MGTAMKTYRGFLFDADNTVFDYDEAERQALDETLDDFLTGVPKEEARAAYRQVNKRFWAAFEAGTVTLQELKVGRFQELLSTLGVWDPDPSEMAHSYLERLASKPILLPHARETVTELAGRARLCLVTNGITSVQRGRLAASGLEKYFAAILISEELGFAKPDARFFARACEMLGLPPSDVLCVGDNPVADVGGAHAAGIDACWYSPAGAVWPGPGAAPLHVASDLHDIVDLAQGLFP